LSYGLTPSGLARGEIVVSQSMVHCNINIALQYHEFVICSSIMDLPDKPAQKPGWTASMLHSVRQAVGLHLGPDLRHIVPEHDDIVLFARLVPDVVA
jgi:hypothetical protein